MKHTVEFQKSGGGPAQCPPNPAFPNGVKLDCAGPGRLACDVTLPYPAPECGLWRVSCSTCGLFVAVTAAGRTDDPTHVRIPCVVAGKQGRA